MTVLKYDVIGYVVDYWNDSIYFGYVKVGEGDIVWGLTKNMDDAIIQDGMEAYNLMNEIYMSTSNPIEMYLYPVIEDAVVACGRVKLNYIATVYRKIRIV